MPKYKTGRILVPGGIVSPGDLRKIVTTAYYFGSGHISIGNRQELLLTIEEKYETDIRNRLQSIQYEFVTDWKYKNVVSSVLTQNIYPSVPWISEGAYLEVINAFDFTPLVSVNMIDPNQHWVNWFSADLNFIASSHENYWFLYLNIDRNKNPELWPVLVDTFEIAKLSKVIDSVVLNKVKPSLKDIEEAVYNSDIWNFRIIDRPPDFTTYRFNSTEGFHEVDHKYWMGIYRKDNKYPIQFMEELCMLCSQMGIGSLFLSTRNSFLIKNIQDKDLFEWEKLLGKHKISTGHSSCDLNWIIPDADEDALELKNYISHKLQEREIRTEGLIFEIASDSNSKSGTIIIQRSGIRLFGRTFLNTYKISYKKSFQINATELIPFAEGIRRVDLANVLIYLSDLYYEEINSNVEVFNTEFQEEVKLSNHNSASELYQCSDCLSIYDPSIGDPESEVFPGTSFDDTSDQYVCPVCEAPKEKFVPVKSA